MCGKESGEEKNINCFQKGNVRKMQFMGLFISYQPVQSRLTWPLRGGEWEERKKKDGEGSRGHLNWKAYL